MRVVDADAIARIFGGSADPSGLPAPGGDRVALYNGARNGLRKARIESGDHEVDYIDAPTQEDALRLLAQITEQSAMASEIQGLARALTKVCPARNDWCELRAIYSGIKKGRPDLRPYGLQKGLRYLADARTDSEGQPTDVFFSPTRLLAMLKRGENGGDCDDHTVLVAALIKDAGFRAGIRAYGEGTVHGYEHVYPVALIPKRGPWNEDAQGRLDESHVVGMDTTVPFARVGWQPPAGDVFTALLD